MGTLRTLSRLLGPVKSVLIWALAALAIYQTGRLWIVSYRQRYDGASEVAVNAFVTPYRLITGTGDGRFTARYTEVDEVFAYSQNALAALLRDGVFVAEGPPDYAALSERPVYICEYAFPMPVEAFAEAFGRRPAQLTRRGIVTFRAAAVFPPETEGDALRVCFFQDDVMWEYRVEIAAPHEPDAAADSGAVYAWEGERFVPLAAPPSPLPPANPYANDFGEKHLDFIKPRVAPFFDNPAAIIAGVGADGVYMFSDINTVVRYYDRDVLTYASYRAVGGSADTDLLTDYAAAAAFIQADPYMLNRFYLAGYTEEDGRHFFWFDYVTKDGPTAADSGHSMEVVTERGTVRKYRKLAYNYEDTP